MNPFRLLGLAEAASADDVKQAWRRLASEHHPDKGGDADSFHRLRTAYEEALRVASAPVPCKACDGRGWMAVSQGWFTSKLQCDFCHGSKVMP